MRILLVLLAFSLNASILVCQEDKPFSYKDDRELFERVVRVEEVLVHMQKTLDKNAEQRDKRFEDLKWFIGLLFIILGVFLGAIITLLAVILTKLLSLTPNSAALKAHKPNRQTDSSNLSSAPDAIEG